MIYSDIVCTTVEGGNINTSVHFDFYGVKKEEDFWKKKITEYMESQKNPSNIDIFRFFALNGWRRAGRLSFYKESVGKKSKTDLL